MLLHPFYCHKKLCSVVLFVGLFLLGGCISAPTPAPDLTSSDEQPILPTETPTLSPSEETELLEPQPLRVWLPPEFNPYLGTEAGEIFLERLNDFSALHPEVDIELRIKAASGPGGMLDSILATLDVAPDAVPDLIALPRPVLETAAVQGLIFSLGDIPAIQEDTDWYDFAHQLARVDNLHYGLPFASDALVLLYRTREITEPPRDWTTTEELALPLLFPLGSADSLFTFTLYQAAGGKVQDAEGHPSITPATLATVYDFYQTAQMAGVFSSSTETYLSEEETFLAYLNGEVDMTIAWVSAYWTRAGEGTEAGALPTPGGVPFTPLTGWAWAIGKPDGGYHELSVELAQFFTETEFLTLWTEAAGYLPPRPSVLAAWDESPKTALASRLVLSGELVPPVEVLTTIGPLLKQGALEVFNGILSPNQAAQGVATQLVVP